MYSPEAMSKDVSSNIMYSSSSGNTGFKNGFLDGDFFKNSKDLLGSSSDLFQNQFHQQQSGTGLMRYRSAPSSFFASYLDGVSKDNTNSDSSESDSMFTALLNCNEPSNGILPQSAQMNPFHHHQPQQPQQHQPQLKLEMDEIGPNQSSLQQNGNKFSSVNSTTATVSVGYQAAVSAGGGTVVGSYPVSTGMENQGRVGMHSSANNSNLITQSSSPAGFFSGYDVMREAGNFRNGNGINGEASLSTGGLNNHMNFTSGSSSSSRFMHTIAENGNEMLGSHSPDHISGYQNKTWNDSSFNSLKRSRDEDLNMFSGFNGLENQDLEPRNHTALAHHLSLPKTANEMSAVEKYLQFQQDSVPCKIRAKRGCATHPRSIAERMRRTRISDRMKKLQELFPNMDKQTNTADMLDLAVEYIKDLQNQVQTLTETRARCTCSSNLQQQNCLSHEHHV